MDNSMTTWIIVALLVLLIGAAIFMLLRRPGGDDDSLDGRDAPAVDRDGHRRDEIDGRTSSERAQAVAPEDQPTRDDAPFDQSSYDGGATPVERPVDTSAGTTDADVTHVDPTDRDQDSWRDSTTVGGADAAGAGIAGAAASGTGYAEDVRETDDHREADDRLGTDDHRSADDFFGVDTADRDETSPDPALQDPRTEGHRLAEDTAGEDTADLGSAASAGYGAAPATEGYGAAPASEGYDARPADEQAYQEDPAGRDDLGHHEQSLEGSHDGEPLTADEVLDARGVADSDTGEGYAAAPVEPDHAHTTDHDRGGLDHDDDGQTGQTHTEPAHTEQTQTQQTHTEPTHTEPTHTAQDGDTGGAFASGAGAPPAASTASVPDTVDEPVLDDGDQPAAGGAVFAESIYGAGSVEPAEDGSGPEGWAVKGNTGSMLFHTADSPSYDAVRAEVWFDSEESARNAGFAHWDRRRR